MAITRGHGLVQLSVVAQQQGKQWRTLRSQFHGRSSGSNTIWVDPELIWSWSGVASGRGNEFFKRVIADK
jgi:hypothetical protein